MAVDARVDVTGTVRLRRLFEVSELPEQGGPTGAGSLDVSDSDQAVRLGNQILHDLRT